MALVSRSSVFIDARTLECHLDAVIVALKLDGAVVIIFVPLGSQRVGLANLQLVEVKCELLFIGSNLAEQVVPLANGEELRASIPYVKATALAKEVICVLELGLAHPRFHLGR